MASLMQILFPGFSAWSQRMKQECIDDEKRMNEIGKQQAIEFQEQARKMAKIMATSEYKRLSVELDASKMIYPHDDEHGLQGICFKIQTSEPSRDIDGWLDGLTMTYEYDCALFSKYNLCQEDCKHRRLQNGFINMRAAVAARDEYVREQKRIMG